MPIQKGHDFVVFSQHGLGDAGAHVTSLTNYAYPTAVLSTFVRERRVLAIEKAVRAMTSVPARLMGLRDRGELLPGMAADICVIDADREARKAGRGAFQLEGKMIDIPVVARAERLLARFEAIRTREAKTLAAIAAAG